MPEPRPNYMKPVTARYTVRVVTSASLSTRLMAKMAGRTLTAHARRISAENRLNTVKAQRDELADALEAWVGLDCNPPELNESEKEAARLVYRVRVAQAAENGPDHD